MANNESFYEYAPIADKKLEAAIKQLSWEAYAALKGTGYGRIDLRMDKHTKQLYVLEVNAQCGLSEDENYTSIGAILQVAQQSFATMITAVITDAINSHTLKNTQP
jgi:D-alanine-D-alanine ligase